MSVSLEYQYFAFFLIEPYSCFIHQNFFGCYSLISTLFFKKKKRKKLVHSSTDTENCAYFDLMAP